MKLEDKTLRRIRNVLICYVIICITPLCYRSRVLNGAHSSNGYAGGQIVCVIDLGDDMYSPHGLLTGFNYELLQRFAKDNSCSIQIITTGQDENYLDSLLAGKVDIVVTKDTVIATDKRIATLHKVDDYSVWAMNRSQKSRVRVADNWIGHVRTTEDFLALKNTYNTSFNPHKRAERGIRTQMVSPYDDLFRKYSEQLGWDWRMVAAVVYQESRFSISSRSSRGAQGLMQVMPQTGNYYGVDNLLDPEQNIMAGTSHLKRLQKLFGKEEITREELIKFTLAAYNAGEGRISDCRNLAAAKGLDSGKWEEVVKVIPMMREDAILEEESVKLGKFLGHETIDYVESVLSHYEAICQITSL